MKPTRRTSAPRPPKPGWTSLIAPKPQFTGCMPRKPMRAAPSNRQKPPICRGLLLFWGNSARFLRMSLLIRRRSTVNPRLPAKKSSSRAAMFPTRRRRKASAIPNPKPSRRKPSAASTCRRRTGRRFRRMCLFRVRRKGRRNRRFQRSKAGADCPEKTEYLYVYPLCRAALLRPQRAKRVRADSGIDHAGYRHDHLSCGRR